MQSRGDAKVQAVAASVRRLDISMSRLLLASLLCAGLVLAGCTGDDPPTTTTPAGTSPAATSPVATSPAATTPAGTTPVVTSPVTPPAYVPYALEVSGFPQAVEAGQNFTFVLRATGGTPATSDHIGAHYGDVSAPSAPANTTTYARACQHITVATPVPGTYNVTCSMPSAGTWYLRGHVRSAGNDSWGSERSLVVRPAWVANGTYALNLTGVPTVVRAGQNFTMNLTMTGTTGVSSHFGAHYGMNSTGAPTTAAYDQACTHQTTITPIPTSAPYVVTCSFGAPGTYYLRGHLRVDEGIPPAAQNYWTGEYAILAL